MNENNGRKSSLGIWIGGILLMLLTGIGVMTSMKKQDAALAKETQQLKHEVEAGPTVKAVKAGFGTAGHELVLIGEARPFQNVTLYAKTSGYVEKINVDKGDRVRAGQLLASIVSPEIDQAYRAAVADLENKKRILERDKHLQSKDYIALQEMEQAATDVQVAEANVSSLRQQQLYKQITAPFNGTVTARFVDAGALVQNATNSQTSAQPIVTVSQLDELRIYVYVEQSDAIYLKNGYPVTVTLPEKPDVNIKATITRLSGELDPKTRMMLVEIDLPDKNNAIIPGSYVQVHISPPASKQLQIPAEALVIKDKKYFVPVIGQDSALHYKPVTIGENDGTRVVILNGLQDGELIGMNVGLSLTEGQKVRAKQ